MKRRLALAATLTLAVTVAVGMAAAPANAAETVNETGTVVHVGDGDTVLVDLDGDNSNSVIPVRLLGIQAMEVGKGTHPIDQCHADEARAELMELALGKHVELASAAKSVDYVRNRLQRTMYIVNGDGTRIDAAARLLRDGQGFWFPKAKEPTHNLEYRRLAAQAATEHLNLWDPTSCGTGYSPDANLSMWVQWDGDGNDQQDPNAEYVAIHNNGSTPVDLSGWTVRETSLSWYGMPAGTVIAPGSTLRLYSGNGSNSSTRLYWGRNRPLFTNIVAGRAYIGDGAYLFDPSGNLRFNFSYPCLDTCFHPVGNAVRISGVNWNPAGNELRRPNSEWVKLTNTSGTAVNLEGTQLVNGGYHYEFVSSDVIPAGATMTILLGKGTNTGMIRHWGFPVARFANSGDKVTLETFDGTVASCKAWGATRC